jgi:hypothetical protein
MLNNVHNDHLSYYFYNENHVLKPPSSWNLAITRMIVNFRQSMSVRKKIKGGGETGQVQS